MKKIEINVLKRWLSDLSGFENLTGLNFSNITIIK